MSTSNASQEAIAQEIAELEQRLGEAKAKLNPPGPLITNGFLPPIDSPLHTLLLLSDSALPLGSFAFSSGLESYLAHHKPSPNAAPTSQVPAFHRFLQQSISTLCTTALPYLLAGYRHPQDILELDNDFDASTPCTVARRASTAQGRALLGVWERSFKAHFFPQDITVKDEHASTNAAVQGALALQTMQSALRSPREKPYGTITLQPNAHLPPLWSVFSLAVRLPIEQAAYLFVFSHARTLASAAVRASVLGPYQAQAVLASQGLREEVVRLIEENWEREVGEAGQSVATMDVWVGRHEVLYSRIFNS